MGEGAASACTGRITALTLLMPMFLRNDRRPGFFFMSRSIGGEETNITKRKSNSHCFEPQFAANHRVPRSRMLQKKGVRTNDATMQLCNDSTIYPRVHSGCISESTNQRINESTI